MLETDKFAFVTIVSDSYFEQAKKYLTSLVKNNTWAKHVKVLYSENLCKLSEEHKDALKKISSAIELTEVDESKYNDIISNGQASPSLFKLEAFNMHEYKKVLYTDVDAVCFKDMISLFLNSASFITLKDGEKLTLKQSKSVKFKRDVLKFHMMLIDSSLITNKNFEKLLSLAKEKYIKKPENYAINAFFDLMYITYVSDIYFADSKYFPNGTNLNIPYKMIHYSGTKPWLENTETFAKVNSLYGEGCKEVVKPAEKKKQVRIKISNSQKSSDINMDEFEKEYLAFIEELKAKSEEENNNLNITRV